MEATEHGYGSGANVDDGIWARGARGRNARLPRVLSGERGFTLIELLVVVTMPFRKR